MLEVVRAIRGWLTDGTDGVNALLPGIPRDGTDGQPANVTVLSEVDDDIASYLRMPEQDAPALVVHATASRWDESSPIAGSIRDGEVDVLVRYQVKGDPTAAAQADTSYTLRAVERCLRRRAYGVQTTVNGVTLYQMTRLERARVDAQLEDGTVTGGVLVTVRVRDGSPV